MIKKGIFFLPLSLPISVLPAIAVTSCTPREMYFFIYIGDRKTEWTSLDGGIQFSYDGSKTKIMKDSKNCFNLLDNFNKVFKKKNNDLTVSMIETNSSTSLRSFQFSIYCSKSNDKKESSEKIEFRFSAHQMNEYDFHIRLDNISDLSSVFFDDEVEEIKEQLLGYSTVLHCKFLESEKGE